MEIIAVERNSMWIEKIISLGDSFRGTLGFLPQQGFYDYASQHGILAAIENEKLMGYTLFRKSKYRIIIVHLCVSPEFRKKGISRALVDELCKIYFEDYSAIQLACRRDYNLDGFWRALGFMPIAERSGRAMKRPSILTVWEKRNPNYIDLFSMLHEMQESRKKVVLDTNVVIDLSTKAEVDSAMLMQPFILNNVEYFITQNVIDELNKSNDTSTRNAHRDYAKSSFEIICLNDKENIQYANVFRDILNLRAADKFGNTWYDISHIAYSIAYGAQVFVTRDHDWTNSPIAEYIFAEYGLLIQTPGELIKSIDEVCSPTAYSPINLIGLNLQYSEMQSAGVFAVVEALFPYYKTGKKDILYRDLRRWMADPEKYHLLMLKSPDKPIALIVYAVFNQTAQITSFIINEKEIKPSLQGTLVKRLAFKILEIAKDHAYSMIEIEKAGIPEKFIKDLEEGLFFDSKDKLIKIVHAGIVNHDRLAEIADHSEIELLGKVVSEYLSPCLLPSKKAKYAIEIEKALWPLKVKKSNIPCYIVPIKGDYAKALFDEDLSNTNISLFDNEQTEPALSIENVYYKNSRKRIQNYPARILWYVSNSKELYGSKMIRACSYLDELEKRKNYTKNIEDLEFYPGRI